MRTRILALLAAMGLVLGLGLAAAPAQATIYIQGCEDTGQTATERVDTFNGDNVGVPAWDTSDATYHLVGQVRYYFCYDNRPDHPNKVYVDQVKFCATKTSTTQPWTGTIPQGFFLNPYFFTLDGDSDVDPGSYQIEWNGIGSKGEEHCTPWQGIPGAIQRWLWQDHRPAWTVTGHVDLKNAPDRDIEFHDVNTGSRAHLFSPNNDPIIAS